MVQTGPTMSDVPVSAKPKHKRPSKEQMEERLVVPLDPEELVGGILQVEPEEEAEDDEGPAG